MKYTTPGVHIPEAFSSGVPPPLASGTNFIMSPQPGDIYRRPDTGEMFVYTGGAGSGWSRFATSDSGNPTPPEHWPPTRPDNWANLKAKPEVEKKKSEFLTFVDELREQE